MPDLLDQLRDRRGAARAAQDAVLTRAAEESRDLTPEELAEHGRQVVAEREANDAMEAERDRELAELRAASTRRPGGTATAEPVLTREASVYDWLQAPGGVRRLPGRAPEPAAVSARDGNRGMGRRRARTSPWPRPPSAPAEPWCRRRSRPGSST